MQGFPGFPEGKSRTTPLPEAFFSELLPAVDDLSELKVTLHCFWLLHQKHGDVRYVTLAELVDDERLVRGLGGVRALREGVERAVARGTLLQVSVHRPTGPPESWYLLNSQRGREALARIERGEWVPGGEAAPVRLSARRPNIFNLYEQNIGLLQPLLAEELKDAEQAYPPEWIEDAFRIAVENNARSWAYVRAVLQRWEREGRGGRRGPDRRSGRGRGTTDDYADLVKR